MTNMREPVRCSRGRLAMSSSGRRKSKSSVRRLMAWFEPRIAEDSMLKCVDGALVSGLCR